MQVASVDLTDPERQIGFEIGIEPYIAPSEYDNDNMVPTDGRLGMDKCCFRNDAEAKAA
jgi:hypothetical protein